MSEPVSRILIVDDVPEILSFCTSVARLLHRADLVIDTTTDPKEAIAMIDRFAYRAVITDYRMPHLNGLDVLLAARKRDVNTLRVLMTGYNEIPAPPGAEAAAAPEAYLKKPFAAQAFLLFLRDVLSEHPSLRDAASVRPEGAQV